MQINESHKYILLSKIITKNINKLINLDKEAEQFIKPLMNKNLWLYLQDVSLLINIYADYKSQNIILIDCYKYKINSDLSLNINIINPIDKTDISKSNNLFIYGKSKYFIKLASTKNPQELFKQDLNYNGSFNILLKYHKFYNQLNLDIDSLLIYLMGDHLGGFAAKKMHVLLDSSKDKCAQKKEKILDYFEREKRVIVPREEIDDFIEEINNLVQDFERLNAKFKKI